MEAFSNIDPINILVFYPERKPLLRRCLSKTIQLGTTLLGAAVYCWRSPYHLIGTVMRLFVSQKSSVPSWQNIDSLAASKEVLKQHRNGEMFHLNNGNPVAGGLGISSSAVLLECEQDQSKRLRGIFIDLFGPHANRKKISEALQQLLPKIQVNTLSDSGVAFPNPWWVSPLTKKIALGVVLGLQLTEDQYEEYRDAFRPTPAAVITINKLRDDHQDADIWQLMSNREYTSEEEVATVAALLLGIDFNISRGLQETLDRCSKEPGLFKHIRDELQTLMDTGDSLEIAVQKSNLLQSVCVEGLRHAPVVPTIARVANQELDAERFGLPAGHIPLGATVGVSISGLGQNEALVGKEPKKFCPMRFMNNRNDFWPGHDFLPFGNGPHQCPAWWLYKEVVTNVVAYLVLRYDSVPGPDGTMVPVPVA